ncbi:MAG: hypothetical protein AMS25_10100 [Gemmatimonas sp. SM23_52]|nr:MAG: hypothetical protein AMS25_10100 [Gemmatimonas sp. SM23_52]
MWLRLLIPLTLIWPVLALAAEATRLRRYRATPLRELLGLCCALLSYFGLWIGLCELIEAVTGSVAAGVIASTILSLLAMTPLLWLGYKTRAGCGGAGGGDGDGLVRLCVRGQAGGRPSTASGGAGAPHITG